MSVNTNSFWEEQYPGARVARGDPYSQNEWVLGVRHRGEGCRSRFPGHSRRRPAMRRRCWQLRSTEAHRLPHWGQLYSSHWRMWPLYVAVLLRAVTRSKTQKCSFYSIKSMYIIQCKTSIIIHTVWFELSKTTTGGTALFSELLRAVEFGSRVPYEFSDRGVLLSGDMSMSCKDWPSVKIV